MKNFMLVLAALIIAAGILMVNRYSLVIHSPIVAKIDNFTGKVWIVNSGVWYQVHDNVQSNNVVAQMTVVPVAKKGK